MDDGQGPELVSQGPISTPRLQMLSQAKIRNGSRIVVGAHFGPPRPVSRD
jgi:hypothetical protein